MKTTIFDWENWREIGVTLAKNKTRTFLTAFGIFWGTVMLALLMGGSQGMEDMIMQNFAGFATNTAFMHSGRRTISYKGFNKGSSWSMSQSDINNLSHNIQGIKTIAPMMNRSSSVVYGSKSSTLDILGQSANYKLIQEPIIYEGRYINEQDDYEERKVCLLGKKVAEDLMGGESPLGKYISIGGIYYKAVSYTPLPLPTHSLV